jgi:hypothetical protein
VQNIDREGLEELLDNQVDMPSSKIVVVIGSMDCHACVDSLPAIKHIEDKFPMIDFYYYEIGIRPPTFAAGVLPTLIGFEKGVKSFEGQGEVDLEIAFGAFYQWVSKPKVATPVMAEPVKTECC